jgi:hypothetical protein
MPRQIEEAGDDHGCEVVSCTLPMVVQSYCGDCLIRNSVFDQWVAELAQHEMLKV